MSHVSVAGARRLDTSEVRAAYVLPLRGGAHLRLSPSAYGLLQAVEAGATFEEIAARAHDGGGRRASAAEVEAAYRDLIARIERSENDAQPLGGGMWLRLRLLPAALVRRVAALTQIAYHPLLAALLVGLIAGGVVVALAVGAHHPHLDGDHFWPAYALFLCALVAHELGHASACARFGAAPSEIGFLLYLVYPAFYSNVSGAWTLSRRQRVVVDVGGVYFELIFGALCALAFALTRWPPLALTLAMIVTSCIVSLNPILKFDGYWVVADALGVTNLGRQPAILFRHLVRRLRGRPQAPLPWPASVVAVLAIYTALSLWFFGWFVSVLAPALVGVVRTYPALVATLARQLAHGLWPASRQLRNLASASYILLFGVVIGRRLVMAVVGMARRR